jgi:hypothetical protein
MGQGVDSGPGGEMDRRPAGPLAVADGRWDPATEPVVLDVIIVYTPRALAAHGDEESLRRGILRMVDDANRTYTNSLIGVRLNPVWVGVHPTWVENGDMGTDFNAISTDSRITAWRNDFKADIVYLVIEADANGYGGGASLLSNPQGDPNRGRCIMRRGVFIGNPLWAEYASLTFTHETAHVLGAGHDREHGYPSAWQGLPSAFPYANGFRFDAGGVTYRTAMAYDPGIQLSLFSNPDQTFDGVQLGAGFALRGAGDVRVPALIFLGLSWGVFVPLAHMLSFAPGQGWFDMLPQFGLGAVGGWFGLLTYVVLLAVGMLLRWRSGSWQRIRI